MQLRLLLATIVSSLLIVTNLKAQTDTTRLTASHLAAACDLISSTGMTDTRYEIMRSGFIKALSETVPEKNREKLMPELVKFFDKYLPPDRFKEDFIKIYAQTFTEDELKQLIIFYNSPLGKKYPKNYQKYYNGLC